MPMETALEAEEVEAAEGIDAGPFVLPKIPAGIDEAQSA
jgi:hypothetical protein